MRVILSKGKSMNECKRDGCGNEQQGKSSYCSESCKTLYNRNKRTGTSQPEQAGTEAKTSAGTLLVAAPTRQSLAQLLAERRRRMMVKMAGEMERAFFAYKG
jgi:hypothetical protein